MTYLVRETRGAYEVRTSWSRRRDAYVYDVWLIKERSDACELLAFVGRFWDTESVDAATQGGKEGAK